MRHIELLSPKPRLRPNSCDPFEYRTKAKSYLRIPDPPTVGPDFFSTILSRRTRRKFGKLSLELVSDLLWYSAKVWCAASPSKPVRWQHRTSPSAGGIHCIDLLLTGKGEEQQSFSLYDPVAHALQEIVVDLDSARDLRDELGHAIDVGPAQVIWFAADCELMFSRYENGESLIWRDAGALVSTICFVAEALGLAYCPIGLTGEPFISSMLGTLGRISGVGGIIVGSRIGD